MKNEITAKRLKMAMVNANIKAQELAERSGLNKASISQYVNGTHAPSNISAGKMAVVLGVSPVWPTGLVHLPNTTNFHQRALFYRLSDSISAIFHQF